MPYRAMAVMPAILLLVVISTCFLPTSQADTFPDWLVTSINTSTEFIKTSRGTLRLTNGLIYREFSVVPDFATIDFYSYEKQQSLLRAIEPEALISLDGLRYNIGGLVTDTPRAYLNRSALAKNSTYNQTAFHYTGYQTSAPERPFKYTPKRGAPSDIVWPPKGLQVIISFHAPFDAPLFHQSIQVKVHYEMYDGIPLLRKWVSVDAPAEIASKVYLCVDEVERLAVNWPWSKQGYQWLFVESDQSHGTNVNWATDPGQSKMPGSFQPLLTSSYSTPPTLLISKFSRSFSVHELVIGSADPERVGLAKRRKLRLLAPQTQENPIFFHMTKANSADFRSVVDQMVEVGFEMLIYSFGSGFQLESTNMTYLKGLRSDIAYANSRGIEVGGYDLIALSRTVQKDWMADSRGHGYGACFASDWYDKLLAQVLFLVNYTGLSMVETDGPYGGYPCYSTNHSHHEGFQDSVYQQQLLQGNFFKILQEKGVYINQPDSFFYQGGSKTGMGYNENQYSLPRWQDLSVSRQGMYDDTFHYIPTVGWMFLPIVDYHGGGAAAMFEPLSEHATAYEWGLAQYLGAGVAACYRGYRLYDSNATKALVTKWVSFYKKHRPILISDIIHVRRADMQSIDCYMHVNPRLEERALAMVFNPTDSPLQMTLSLPLYYTGLTDRALVSEQEGRGQYYTLDRHYNIHLNVSLPPLGITWYLIK